MRKLLKMLAAVVLRQRGGPNGAQVGHMHGGTININNHLPKPVDQEAEAQRTELFTLMGKLTRTGQRKPLQRWMQSEFGTAYVKELTPGQVGRAVLYARAMYAKISRQRPGH